MFNTHPPLDSWHLLYKTHPGFCYLLMHLFSLSVQEPFVWKSEQNSPLKGFSAVEREKNIGKKMKMNCKVSFGWFAMFSFVFAIFLLPAVQGHQHLAPAPSPTSDGTTVDQGIACFLMLLALVLTYLIHSLDAPLVA